jgi:prepilin-type N-terminal cleavage/methylation domain-containing protein
VHASRISTVIDDDMQRNVRRGFSLVELLVVVTIIMIIVAIAVPNALRTKMSAAETAVIREMQTIHQAQLQYYSQYGKYAGTLAELGPKRNGQGSGLIPGSLASGRKDGYIFTLSGGGDMFWVSAVPTTFDVTGSRTFFIDQSGIVHFNRGSEPATENSAELE